jgi:hypothetical protein
MFQASTTASVATLGANHSSLMKWMLKPLSFWGPGVCSKMKADIFLTYPLSYKIVLYVYSKHIFGHCLFFYEKDIIQGLFAGFQPLHQPCLKSCLL